MYCTLREWAPLLSCFLYSRSQKSEHMYFKRKINKTTKTQSLELEMWILVMWCASDTVGRWVFIVYDFALLWASWDYVSTDLCSDTAQKYVQYKLFFPLSPLRGQDATCHICVHVGEPDTTVYSALVHRRKCTPLSIYKAFCQKKLVFRWKRISVMEVRFPLSIGPKSWFRAVNFFLGFWRWWF